MIESPDATEGASRTLASAPDTSVTSPRYVGSPPNLTGFPVPCLLMGCIRCWRRVTMRPRSDFLRLGEGNELGKLREVA